MSHQDAEKNKQLRETIIEIDEDGKVHGDISELKAAMPIVPSDPDDPRFDGVVVERAASGGALSAEQVQEAYEACGHISFKEKFYRALAAKLNESLAAHDQKVREQVCDLADKMVDKLGWKLHDMCTARGGGANGTLTWPEINAAIDEIDEIIEVRRALASRAEEKETKP